MSFYRLVFNNSIVTFISRVLGFVRDVLLAQYIGAGWQMDAFLIVFKLPNLFRRLFADGVFTQSLLPAAVSSKEQPHFLANMFGMLCMALFLISLPFLLFPRQMLSVLVMGVQSGPVMDLATQMLPIIFPYLAIVSCCGFYTVQLNIKQKFTLSAALPIVLNLGLISGIILIAKGYGNIGLLAYSVIIAGSIQLGICWIAIYNVRGTISPSCPQLNQETIVMLKQASMAFLSQVVMYLSSCADLFLASFLVSGSLSWLYYTDRLVYLPVGVLSVSMANILLPRLSVSALKNDSEGLHIELDRASRCILLVAIPITIGGYLFSIDIVQLLFGSKKFTQTDVLATSSSLKIMMCALPAMMLNRVWMTAAYAKKQANKQLKISLFSFFVSLSVSALLLNTLGHLAISMGACCSAWIQSILLHRYIVMMLGKGLYDRVFLTILSLASCFMIIVCQLESKWHLFTTNTKLALFGELAIKSSIAIALFGVLFFVIYRAQRGPSKLALL